MGHETRQNTFASQIAGKDYTVGRPVRVAEKTVASESPLWVGLLGVKRGGSHLHLRYSF